MSFIVLEGIDGSGTTTQAQLLVGALEAVGKEALLTREPTTGPIGRFLRQALAGRLEAGDGTPAELEWSAMALLFAADRLDHVKREIEPALRRGATVVSDRYDLSSLIYQSATCPDGEVVVPWLKALNQRALRPDLTLVLDVTPEQAEARRASRSEEPEIFDQIQLQRRLSDLYKRPGDFLPDDRIELVSGSGTVSQVHEAVLRAAAILPEVGKTPPASG